MRIIRRKSGVVLTVLGLLAFAAHGQQRDPRTNGPVVPLPPLSAGESSSKNPADATAQSGPSASGRSTPLTSMDGRSLGGNWSGRNFLVPSFTVFMRGESNSPGGMSALGTLSGRLAFQRVMGRREFTSDYAGSGNVNLYRSNQRSEMFHSWQMAFRTSGRRWSASLSNSLGYSPEGGNAGGLGNQGGGNFGNSNLVNLNPFLQQNQAILGFQSPRISNTVAGQVAYQLTNKSAMTFSANYGILRFLDAGFIKNDHYSVRTGYNRTLSGRHQIAVSHGVSFFKFRDGQGDNQSHVAQFNYGRQLTGRLSLNLGAGPSFSRVQIPGGEVWQTSWSANSGLQYRMGRTTTSLDYFRGVTGGAGFFRGAQTDEVRGTISRQLTRQWNASANAGFTHNQDLISLASGVGGRRFNSWRGGLNVGRPVGRLSTMFFQYAFDRQTSSNIGCTGAACAFIGTRQTFGIGFNFGFSPIELN